MADETRKLRPSATQLKSYYPVKQSVSVWAGTFPTESDFDLCIDSEITPRLALDIPIESICEIAFEQEPVPIRQLIEGFSGWQSFLAQVEQAAMRKNLISANAALVCYYLKCEDVPESLGKLRFLGSFAGQDIS